MFRKNYSKKGSFHPTPHIFWHSLLSIVLRIFSKITYFLKINCIFLTQACPDFISVHISKHKSLPRDHASQVYTRGLCGTLSTFSRSISKSKDFVNSQGVCLSQWLYTTFLMPVRLRIFAFLLTHHITNKLLTFVRFVESEEK